MIFLLNKRIYSRTKHLKVENVIKAIYLKAFKIWKIIECMIDYSDCSLWYGRAFSYYP